MYVNFNSEPGTVGDTRKANGLTYEKQRNGKWMLVRNKALRKLLTRLYVTEKKTLHAITAETGIPHTSVQRALNEFELMRSKKAYSAPFKEFFARNEKKLWAMYEKGRTTAEIAKGVNAKLGTDYSWITLDRAFTKAGYTLRTHQEAITNAEQLGRRDKCRHTKGEGVWHKPAIAAWNYHLDFNLADLTIQQYKRIVYRFTYMVIKRYPQFFPENAALSERTGSGIELDHQFSRSNGYWVWDGEDYVKREQPIALEVMCHPANLKLMSAKTNSLKGARNHISLKDLMKRIEAFNKEHGDLFDGYYEKHTKPRRTKAIV